jgi:hypothetical protein
MIKINLSRFPILMVALLTTSGIMAQFGPMPSAGSMGMPAMPAGAQQGFGGPQAGPAAGMPMPSEQELEQILKMIEQAAAENPELIKEWERQGQREILKMSEADLAAFGQMVGIAPEVLREEAEKALADELGAAAHTAPQAAAFEEEFMQPTLQQKPAQPAAQKPSKGETLQTGALVKGLIKNLSELQAKAASVREVHELIRAWLQELRELMFYVNVIDRHEYHEHLSLPKFKGLKAALEQLYSTLRTEVPHVALPDDLLEEPTAYDLLGVKKSAKDAVIDASYERLVEKHDPKKLEKELRAQGLDEKAIKQQVKKATLSFEAIEDAYEQLHNPQLRAQIDREIEAHKGLKQQKIAQATQALKTIRHAFEEAIYGSEVLFNLEHFLQDYAPQQLALKKTIEDAEKKSLEEQKKHAAIKPTTTYGTFEPEVRYTQPYSYDDYGYGSNFNPYSDYGNYYDNYPDYSYASDSDFGLPSSKGTGPAEKEAGKGTGQEASTAKEERKYAGPTYTMEDINAAKKIDEREPLNIIKDIIKNFDTFIEQLTKEPEKTHNQTIINNIGSDIIKAMKNFQEFKTKKAAAEKKAAEAEEIEEVEENEEAERKTEIVLESPAQKDAQVIAKKLQDLSTNLKLEPLATDAEHLMKIFKEFDSRHPGASTSADQRKEWKKFWDKLEESDELIDSFKQTMDDVAKTVSPELLPNYRAAFKSFVDPKGLLAKFRENAAKINKDYIATEEKEARKETKAQEAKQAEKKAAQEAEELEASEE